MAWKIRLREIAQLARREIIFDPEKPMVTGIRAQPVEVTRQPLFVIGADRPNPHGSTVG